MSPFRVRGSVWIALAVLTLAALVLRTSGLDSQLPQRVDDDSLIVAQARTLRALAASPSADVEVAPQYPLLLAGALAALPPSGLDPEAERADPLAYHLARAAREYLRARWLVALLGALAVPLTWLLARRFVGPRWALLAGALVATSLLHARLSAEARPHAALATLLLLALGTAVRLAERGGWRAHLLAGLGAGLALACLHTGASALLALGAAQLVRLRHEGRRALPAALAAWVPVALLGWLAYFPPIPRITDAGLSTSGDVVTLSGHSFPLGVFDGSGFARLPGLLLETDPLLLLLGLVGLLLAARQLLGRRARPGVPALVLLAWALPFVLVLGLYGRLPARFLLPLVPVLAILAAGAARALAARSGPARSGRPAWLVATALAAVLALPTYASTRLARQRSVPDTASLAAGWIASRLDRERDLLYLSASVCLPLFVRDEGDQPLVTRPFYYWDNYQSALPDELRLPRSWRVRHLIGQDPAARGAHALDEASLSGLLELAPNAPVGRRWALVGHSYATLGRDRSREAVTAAGGRAVLELSPYRADRHAERGARLPPRPSSLRDVLTRRRRGQTLVLYELPPQLEPQLATR